jgi:hypothetical protein
MDQTNNTTSPLLSDGTYQFLKNLVQLFLPAFATFYLTLGETWGLPYGQQVVTTSAALATFLGMLLRISTKSYNASDSRYDGQLVVTTQDEGGTLYSLELNGDPEDLVGRKAVSFKVQ